MFDLMADNPVYDTKACTNSASSLNEGLTSVFHSNSKLDEDDEVCHLVLLRIDMLKLKKLIGAHLALGEIPQPMPTFTFGSS